MIYPKPQSGVFAQDAPESEIKPFDAWLRGLGIAFDETNGFPDMESFNGLLQTLNSYIKYLEQNGFAEWTADLEYPIGAGVRVGSTWYRAKTQNTNKPPATSQNDWVVFLNASDLTYGDPLQNVGGVISVKDATTTRKGVTRFATALEVSNRINVSAVIKPSDIPTSVPRLTTSSGSAPSFSARAWVRFAASGGILDSGNVNNIVRLSSGVYRVEFATAMQTPNYAAVFTTNLSGGFAYEVSRNNSSITLSTKRDDGGSGDADCSVIIIG